MQIIIIMSLFSDDYIVSTDTYLTYDPLNIKSRKHICIQTTCVCTSKQGNNWYQRTETFYCTLIVHCFDTLCYIFLTWSMLQILWKKKTNRYVIRIILN